MRPLVVAAMAGGVALLALGCKESASRRVEDPWPLVKWLIERNRAPIEQDPYASTLLTREKWQRLHLEFFKGGGVAVYWDRGGIGTLGDPLVFREDGTYLCSPIRYAPIDVTGDGARDLVTTEWITGKIGFRVYDLTKTPIRRVTLGSMHKYSFSKTLHPGLWDADGDGVFEIICLLPLDGLDPDCDIDTTAVRAAGVDGLITVWSLLGGVPRVVLAIGNLPFQGPDEFLHSGLYLGAPGQDPTEAVSWDAGAGRFRLPKIADVRVFVNRSIHPRADGNHS